MNLMVGWNLFKTDEVVEVFATVFSVFQFVSVPKASMKLVYRVRYRIYSHNEGTLFPDVTRSFWRGTSITREFVEKKSRAPVLSPGTLTTAFPTACVPKVVQQGATRSP